MVIYSYRKECGLPVATSAKQKHRPKRQLRQQPKNHEKWRKTQWYHTEWQRQEQWQTEQTGAKERKSQRQSTPGWTMQNSPTGLRKMQKTLQRQMQKKTEQPLRESTESTSKRTTLMTMHFLMRHTRQLANLMGDSPRGGEMSRRDRGDGHRLGEHDGKINLPHTFQTAPDSMGLWLVPKKYSTQNTAVMFVQYISPI